jgi:hypothetical protein
LRVAWESGGGAAYDDFPLRRRIVVQWADGTLIGSATASSNKSDADAPDHRSQAALASHGVNVSEAADELGVASADLRHLLWARPALMDAAAKVEERRLERSAAMQLSISRTAPRRERARPIARNVRRIWVAKGILQERLAFDSEFDRSYLGRIEREAENPTVHLFDIGAVLGVPSGELFV